MANAAVSFGFLLPTREVVMAQQNPDPGYIIELAKRAEELGFDSVWVGDSVLARPRLEALTTLAGVASRTQRVKLGTAVLLSALRHPVVLANEAANLDLLSRGRLILGLGIGSRNAAVEHEFNACGVPFARRARIFEEGITVMRRMWAEPEVTFKGSCFQLDRVRLGLRPVQQEVPSKGVEINKGGEYPSCRPNNQEGGTHRHGKDNSGTHRSVKARLGPA